LTLFELPQEWVRNWIAIIIHPKGFFEKKIKSGKQSDGLIFAMVVVMIEEGSRIIIHTPWTVTYFFISLGVAVLIVTPILLHIVAAIQTLLLRMGAKNRKGIGATVQVIGYSIAPCIFAGFAIPSLRVLCAIYGSILLIIGLKEVHDVSLRKAFLISIIPAIIVFGLLFRGILALNSLLA
tara:strand:+ start:506 stop:1045 length:540 start_codon:yes stop_codon:yes gene_type:complete